MSQDQGEQVSKGLCATYMDRCGLRRLTLAAVQPDGHLVLEGDHGLELNRATQLIIPSTPPVKVLVNPESVDELEDGGFRTTVKPLALSTEQRVALGLALREQPSPSASAPRRRRPGGGVTLAPPRSNRWWLSKSVASAVVAALGVLSVATL